MQTTGPFSAIDELSSRFRGIDRLGSGGQGSVYLVEDRLHGGLVALKIVLWDDGGTTGAATTLREEFLTLQKLAHPSLASVYEFGFLPSRAGAFFTTEYISGLELLAWARQAERSAADFISLAAQLLSALDYLEGHGIHHGDIKPQNLIVEESSREESTEESSPPCVRIVDFGSARLRRSESRSLWRTLAYSPPEAHIDAVDEDLFALGMTLLHALVGRLPFADGDAKSVEAWWKRKDYASLSEFDAEAPKILDDLIRRMTSWREGERLRNARDALVFLGNVTHPQLPRSWSAGAECRLQGRDELLANLLSVPARAGHGAILLAGAAGSGRTRFLGTLRSQVQAAGGRALLLESSADLRPFFDVGDTASSDAALRFRATLPPASFVLVDDAEVGVPSQLLLDCVRGAAADTRRGKRLCVVLATSNPDEVISAHSLQRDSLRVSTLPSLDHAQLASMVSDYFRVDSVPESLIRLVELSSGGFPAAAMEVLDQIRGEYVRVDLSGRIELQKELPSPLATRAQDRRLGSLLHLANLDRRRLAELTLAGTPLLPEDAARIFGGSHADWKRSCEALAWRGCVRRTEAGRFEKLSSLPVATCLGSLNSKRIEELRLELTRRLDETRPPDCIVLFEQLTELDFYQKAARVAIRATRGLRRNQQEGEALRILELALKNSAALSSRSKLVLGLRHAAICEATGEAERGWDYLEKTAAIETSLSPLTHLRGRLAEATSRRELAIRCYESLSNSPAIQSSTPRYKEMLARLTRLYFQAGRTQDGIRALEAGRELAVHTSRTGSNVRLSRAFSIYGSCEFYHGDASWAKRELELAIDLAQLSEDPSLIAEPLNHLGVLAAARGNLEDSIRAFERLERNAIDRRQPLAEIRAILNQAHAWSRRHRLDKMEELHRRACNLSDAIGRHRLSSTCWLGLAAVLRRRGRLREAHRLYLRVSKARTVTRRNDLIIAGNNLGELYLASGHLHRSLETRRVALEEARDSGNSFLIGLCARGLGAILLATGNSREARAALEECIETEEDSSDPRHVGGALFFLGVLARMSGDLRKAVKRFRSALISCRSSGESSYEEASWMALLDILIASGRRKYASDALKRRLKSNRPPAFEWRAPMLFLELRARPCGKVEEYQDVLREAEKSGEIWSAFFACVHAVRDERLSREIRSELTGRIRHLSMRLSRRLDPTTATELRALWLANDVEDVDGSNASLQATISNGWIKALSSGSGNRIPDVLESLRIDLRARGVWTINQSMDREPFTASSRGSSHPARLPPPELLKAQSRDGSALRCGDDLICPLDTDSSRWLYAQDIDWRNDSRDPQSIHDQFRAAAVAIELLRLLEEKEASLRHHRRLLRESRKHVRKLSESSSREKNLPDTERITRRVELVKAARDADTQAQDLAAPIASSRAMREILSRLPRIAESDMPVLILGESGVGKDFLARWIHHLSRRDRMVSEACSLPDSLLEAELFGFVQGAFTDAVEDRSGIFERASGGSLYLDEISDVSPRLQSRLLRVLETQRVRPIGSDEERAVDFRLISSSRLSSVDDVQDVLRDDLFYRLRGEVIIIPPLHERPEDIEPIAISYLRDVARKRGSSPATLLPETLDKLRAHHWPGNVRELENELDRALIQNSREVSPQDVLPIDEAHSTLSARVNLDSGLKPARDAFEKRLVVAALKRHGGNASHAAETLRVSRRFLGKLLGKHGLDLQKFK